MIHRKNVMRKVGRALLICAALAMLSSSARCEEMPLAPRLLPQMRAAKAAGPEVVGVLEAGPEIALYVAQAADNDYYLTHDVSGRENSNGAAFLDARCSLSPRSAHLMIHGHNMRSGAVFGKLDAFLDADFVRENPLIYWTTDFGGEVYVPYAVAAISVDPSSADYFRMTRWNFADGDAYMAFVDGLRARTSVALPVDVRPGDALLSLVTCGYDSGDGRLVVALRRLREGESEAEVAARFRDAL